MTTLVSKPSVSPMTTPAAQAAISAQQVQIGYARRTVIDGVDLQIEAGTVTCLIGPNGSGKSTLLKGCARLLDLNGGAVFIDGHDMSKLSSLEVARKLAVLPQTATAPSDLTVRELVEQGRYPHVGALRMLRKQDGEAVARALAATGMSDFADRDIEALSGGERQRAWIALALAQETPTLFLDEPTTYLDICYQLEVMHLVRDLNTDGGITVVMVLHDLNQAAAYSDRVICLNKGKIVADGKPIDVLTPALLRDVFRIEASVISDPRTGRPVFVPHRPLHGNESKGVTVL